MRRKSYSVNSRSRRARADWQNRRESVSRRAAFEALETRDMLTILSFWVHDMRPAEFFGPAGTLGELYRYGDTSEPLTVMLTSSDETEVLVPESVTIPADETSVTFPIDLVDDTLLDGEQLVSITATGDFEPTDAWLFVQDYETADLTFDQSELSPGDTLTGTVTISVMGNTEPVSVPIVSDRPDEIASIVVEVPVGQQSVDFEIPVTSNGIAEGPHAVQLNVPYQTGLYGNLHWVSVSDPGVNTLQPVDDGDARDADRDGLVFEQLTLTSTQIATQAASSSGSWGEARGILEFDVSSIPSGATFQSAVLTVNISGSGGTTPMIVDFFAYNGNGTVEASDAVQSDMLIGQLTTTPGIEGLKSTPIILDASILQTLIQAGDFVGIMSKLAPPFANTGRFLGYNSVEHFYEFFRPSLHLVWSVSGGPAITANSLSIQEGGTVTLNGSNLAATDSDSDEDALVFTVANVTRGQFLVNGSSATSFTQADITAGLVTFAHDGSEFAPTYEVSVSDGTTTFGPHVPAVNLTNVNDNPPVIVPGQVFQVGENSVTGTIVGSVDASDADLPGDQIGFEIIAGNDDGVFAIDNDGNITIADDTHLDFEAASQHVLTIAVLDMVHWSSEDVTIDVVDEDEIVPILTIDDTNLYEIYEFSETPTFAHVQRQGGDLSQPLTVLLTSSNESKLAVPTSIFFEPFETVVSFPIEVFDDTLLGGTQIVTVTASVVGGDASAVDVAVHDVETVSIDIDEESASPGDTLNATVTVSTTGRTEPMTVWLKSTRPDEIATIPVVIEPHQQSVVMPVPISADGISEGLHPVIVSVHADGYNTYVNLLGGPSNNDTEWLELSDPDVTTIRPTADGRATDVNQDGNVFEQLDTHTQVIFTQAASILGSFGETRGILEFDVSTIPAGAIIESAVLTIDVNWAGDYPLVNDVVMDAFAYQGNGVVESVDASQLGNHVGQLSIETDGSQVLASFPILLDLNDVQSLVDSGGHIGIVAKMQESLVQFYSKEISTVSSKPALHLVLAYPPTLVTSALSLNEGETKLLTAGNLSATDPDSDESELTFTVSSVTGGQFFVGGAPATSFTQAQIAAAQVAFAHDGGEVAPSFAVQVSDGTYSDGQQPASIYFTNVNDNAPQIPLGQAFSVSEAASDGATVGTVAFSDADLPGDSFVVTITAGNSAGIFAIDNAGNLTIANNTQLDFESTSSYALTISVFDGVNTTNQVVTVNIVDADETKFYVVDDGSSNRTYEYVETGAAVENYTLTSANSAPRGAASTIAGDRVWVVDNNRKVYVYDTGGGLLGSWTAGSLATPHGIATNGTDVWIVDDNSNKVFKYAGAASRLSGSQNAASSFNLNSSNSSPRDIVTDGTSLWVVNDSGTDKVFKYTVAGSLLGSWTISSANSKPTGITIDPANVSDIWIVDSGTDRVYQYMGAASRTSGSQSAATSFALATGNTNPQGIADPPPRIAAQFDSLAVDQTSPQTVAVPTAPEHSKQTRRRINIVAREQYFDSLATERFDSHDNRAQLQVSADFPIASYHQLANDDHAAMDDAFESGLFGGLNWGGQELILLS